MRRSTTLSRCSPISCGRCGPTGTQSTTSTYGGGLGIPYRVDHDPPPLPDVYAKSSRAARAICCTLYFEPGRLIVGNAGVLATTVLYVKRGDAGLRHRRCGDERPRPSDPLRRAS